MVLEGAAEKKAEDPISLDLRKISSFTDCFIILSGNQIRQTQAICDAILERLAAEGTRPRHVEGYDHGEWILIDLSDLVVHIFVRETREFYGLERLWGDAPKMTARRAGTRARCAPSARGPRGPKVTGRRKG